MHGSVAGILRGERFGRGALFLKSESFDEHGKPEEPTVTILGSATRVAQEAKALHQVGVVASAAGWRLRMVSECQWSVAMASSALGAGW